MRTCGLSHQIKGPVIVNLTILQLKPVLANFTVVGPLIWCDNPQVRLSKILYINNYDFHHLGRAQMCAGTCCYFRTSKPHSGTLWHIIITTDIIGNPSRRPTCPLLPCLQLTSLWQNIGDIGRNDSSCQSWCVMWYLLSGSVVLTIKPVKLSRRNLWFSKSCIFQAR